jgi:hypothetical protein
MNSNIKHDASKPINKNQDIYITDLPRSSLMAVLAGFPARNE